MNTHPSQFISCTYVSKFIDLYQICVSTLIMSISNVFTELRHPSPGGNEKNCCSDSDVTAFSAEMSSLFCILTHCVPENCPKCFQQSRGCYLEVCFIWLSFTTRLISGDVVTLIIFKHSEQQKKRRRNSVCVCLSELKQHAEVFKAAGHTLNVSGSLVLVTCGLSCSLNDHVFIR